ncbi:MAG: hypothetical protein RML72_09770 [Bacteroidia bacterium]|nr:hypothetical protein [Bacteroidia bacterium]MDW8159143.1 hypothetical protein [Bacteroidia bacterium]
MLRKFIFCAIVAIILVGACSKEDNEPLPTNQKPVIRKISPSSPSVIARGGEKVKITFLAADNEALEKIEIEEIILTNVQYRDSSFIRNGVKIDSLISRGDTLSRKTILSKKIRGTVHTETVDYEVSSFLPPLARIDIIAQVTDNIQQKARTQPFYISVDFDKNNPVDDAFGLESYENIKLYARNSRKDSSAYNLISNRYSNIQNLADIDIQEVSDTNNTLFRRILQAPNPAQDSTLVVLNDNILNYNQLTYSIMRGAFMAHPQRKRTSPLRVGDIVLVKLRLQNPNYNNWPHYAALRIKAIIEQGRKDNYLLLDYKRSFSR